VNTKRHLLQVCLLCAALLPAAVQAQFTFTIKNDAVTITGYTGPGGVVTIPSTTNGYPVTSIADSVFQNKSSVTSVIIPDSVTNVGNSTFNYCTGLTNISIGSSVASIGNSMFFFCYRLVGMAIPNSVKNIGTNAFFECSSLTNISIPSSVTNIGDMAFFECSGLKGIYFHGNAPSIGSLIFFDDNNPFDDNNTTIYYWPGTTGWGTTFGGLPTVQIQFTYTTNNGTINITGYTGSGGVVTILDTIDVLPVTSIGSNAFQYCTNLTNITIPNSVVNIGENAFQGCYNLTNILIGINVTNMEAYAFQNCSNLASIYFQSNAPGTGAFVFSNDNQATIYYLAGTTGWDSVFGGLTTELLNQNNCAYKAINGTISLTRYTGSSGELAIPRTMYGLPVTTIGLTAFYHCISLTNIIIPDSVTSIVDDAFVGCSNLIAITIPNSVANIASETFADCSCLTSILIGNSVTNLGDYAFQGCGNLTSMYFQGNAPSLGIFVFDGDTNAIAYYLPGTMGWSSFSALPAVLWNPQAQTSDGSFGVQANQFGFNITGSSNLVIVVEACTNFSNPVWLPVSTNTLNTFIGTNGTSYFSDPQWTNYSGRFYHLRSP
jgi:hypothetical protein